MEQTYLMSAFHVEGFNRIPIAKIATEFPNQIVTVYANLDNSWHTFVLENGHEDIGSKFVYIKDTGNGYGHIPHERRVLTVVNIITIVDGVATGVNDIGMTTAHSLKVYK